MKWIKTCYRPTTLEERFWSHSRSPYTTPRDSRRPDMLASLCKTHPRRQTFKLVCLTNNYRYCTVLLVLNNSVSNLTNLYLFNQNVENLRIQTLPSNSPFPIPWPRDVCLELSFLQPPLWKNPGSTPGSSWMWITKSHFLSSANAMVSCKYVFHAGPGLFVFFAGCSILYRSKKRRMDSTLRIALSRLLFK